MKRLAWFLIVFTLFLHSCGNDKFTTEQKNYLLPDQYENIGQQGLVYIPHIGADFVSVLNPSGMKLAGKIPAGNGPCRIIILNDGSKGYITNFMSNDVTVFDPATNKALSTVKTQEHPSDLLELSQQKKILVTHESGNTIDVINIDDNNVTALNEVCTGPMYYLKNSGKIYVPQIFSPFIKIIDPATLHIVSQITTGGRPMSMAFTSDEKFGYLANFDSAEIAKIDITKEEVVIKIKDVKSPRGICISPDNKLLAVTNVVDNSLTVIDLNTDKITKIIYGLSMPTFVIYSHDGNYMLVCNQGNNTISVIDAKSLEIKDNIKVASNPISLFGDYR